MLNQRPEIIESIADLAEFVNRKSVSDRYLFRGQNVDKPLLPSIARQDRFKGTELVEIENKMLDRLKKEAIPFIKSLPTNDWGWLSIAQHQGMTTRLLDWSASALSALWFAVSSDPPEGADVGVVWIFNLSQDDVLSPDAMTDVFSLPRTFFFQPFHIDQRISAQAAWFSAHKYMSKEGGKFIPLEQNENLRSRLIKVLIPRECFFSIRRELRVMGVTRASLFPGLAGLSTDINLQFLQDECVQVEDLC